MENNFFENISLHKDFNDREEIKNGELDEIAADYEPPTIEAKKTKREKPYKYIAIFKKVKYNLNRERSLQPKNRERENEILGVEY